MRTTKLAGPIAVRSKALDELSVRRELRDAADAVRRILIEKLCVVGLGDEDRTVRSDEHIVRLGEFRRRIARFTGRAERHQQFSLRAELEDGVALVLPF